MSRWPSHSARRARHRQALDAAVKRCHMQSALIVTLAEERPLAHIGKPDFELVDRLRAIAPCVEAQIAAGRAGQPAHSPRKLVSSDTNILHTAAKHIFDLEVPFAQLTARKARQKQRGITACCSQPALPKEFLEQSCMEQTKEMDVTRFSNPSHEVHEVANQLPDESVTGFDTGACATRAAKDTQPSSKVLTRARGSANGQYCPSCHLFICGQQHDKSDNEVCSGNSQVALSSNLRAEAPDFVPLGLQQCALEGDWSVPFSRGAPADETQGKLSFSGDEQLTDTMTVGAVVSLPPDMNLEIHLEKDDTKEFKQQPEVTGIIVSSSGGEDGDSIEHGKLGDWTVSAEVVDTKDTHAFVRGSPSIGGQSQAGDEQQSTVCCEVGLPGAVHFGSGSPPSLCNLFVLSPIQNMLIKRRSVRLGGVKDEHEQLSHPRVLDARRVVPTQTKRGIKQKERRARAKEKQRMPHVLEPAESSLSQVQLQAHEIQNTKPSNPAVARAIRKAGGHDAPIDLLAQRFPIYATQKFPRHSVEIAFSK